MIERLKSRELWAYRFLIIGSLGLVSNFCHNQVITILSIIMLIIGTVLIMPVILFDADLGTLFKLKEVSIREIFFFKKAS